MNSPASTDHDVTLPAEKPIDNLRDLLAAIEQRAMGWNERADSILNGRMMRDELIVIGNTLRPLVPSESGGASCDPIGESRCDGRYPVPGKRDEPFPVTYRCGKSAAHAGEHSADESVSSADAGRSTRDVLIDDLIATKQPKESETSRTDALADDLIAQRLGCNSRMLALARQLERELADRSLYLLDWYKAASPYATPQALQEALASLRSATTEKSEDAACKVAADLLRAEVARLEYPKSMFPQEREKIARRQLGYEAAIRFLDPLPAPDSRTEPPRVGVGQEGIE